MSQKINKRSLHIALLTVGILAAVPVAFADGANTSSGAKSSASTINLAGLAAVLKAASDRKQSGTEITLKKDAFLHGRPTGDEAKSGVIPAGTILRQSKKQLVNATGTWRHVETRDGRVDGWVHELDLLEP